MTTVTVTVTVTDCAKCPFVNGESQPWYCDAEPRDKDDLPRLIGHMHYPWPQPPEWCPLREADRLVTLRLP